MRDTKSGIEMERWVILGAVLFKGVINDRFDYRKTEAGAFASDFFGELKYLSNILLASPGGMPSPVSETDKIGYSLKTIFNSGVHMVSIIELNWHE